jgi:hypothetical protein
MGIESTRSLEASRFIESLNAEEREAVDASVATVAGLIAMGIDLTPYELPIAGSRGRLVARVEKVHSSHHRISVEVTEINSAESRTKQGRMTKNEALRIVSDGIGKRPDLPTGAEYVERARGVWRGLSGRRAS